MNVSNAADFSRIPFIRRSQLDHLKRCRVRTTRPCPSINRVSYQRVRIVRMWTRSGPWFRIRLVWRISPPIDALIVPQQLIAPKAGAITTGSRQYRRFIRKLLVLHAVCAIQTPITGVSHHNSHFATH
jgi:hypothetical protein